MSTRRLLCVPLCALLLPFAAHAQSSTVCPASVKEEVAKYLAEKSTSSEQDFLAAQAEMYSKYKGCAQDGHAVAPDDPFHGGVKACGARAPYIGSIHYEEMSCCGYDPQRRTFACPVKIKQNFGFGGTPLPGSREYVLHCVADPQGVLRPVGLDSVHLSNAMAGQSPTWQFAVVTAANQNLGLVQPMNNQTRRARSILSWNLQPTGCGYQPIWGNVLDYRIRLDQ